MSLESFMLTKDMTDERRGLEEGASKMGLAGTAGGILGSLALTALLGPVGLAYSGLVAGAGSALGNVAGRHLFTSKETKEDIGEEGNLFYGDERQEIEDKFTADMISGSLTSAVTAGFGEFAEKFAVSGVDDLGNARTLGERIKFASGIPEGEKAKLIGNKFWGEDRDFFKPGSMKDDTGFFQGGKKDRRFGRVRDIFDKDNAKITSMNEPKDLTNSLLSETTVTPNKITNKPSGTASVNLNPIDDYWSNLQNQYSRIANPKQYLDKILGR